MLVAYASHHGATREVAERVGGRLRAAGLEADVRDVDTQPGVSGYDAVVLGSATQGAAWLPQAVQFAHRHLHALAAVPLWLFTVGLQPAADAQRGPFARMIRAATPREVPGLQLSLHPVDHHAFAGAVDRDSSTGPEKALFRLLGGRFGDFRDWVRIEAWADGIGTHLRGAGGTTGTAPTAGDPPVADEARS
ncbi:flavodoxin domain-containing protein [Thalassiella azotivora]